MQTDRAAEALPLARRAHAIYVNALGADHPSTRTVAGTLAAVEAAAE